MKAKEYAQEYMAKDMLLKDTAEYYHKMIRLHESIFHRMIHELQEVMNKRGFGDSIHLSVAEACWREADEKYRAFCKHVKKLTGQQLSETRVFDFINQFRKQMMFPERHNK